MQFYREVSYLPNGPFCHLVTIHAHAISKREGENMPDLTRLRDDKPGVRWIRTLSVVAAILLGLGLLWAFATHGTANVITTAYAVSGPDCGPVFTVVSSPNHDIHTGSSLYDVAAVSTNDIWAVGDYTGYITTTLVRNTLTEHWDGSAWSVVPSPNHTGGNGDEGGSLSGVAVAGTYDVWAVGWYQGYNPNNSNFDGTITEHWNGSAWSLVANPVPAGTTSSRLWQ